MAYRKPVKVKRKKINELTKNEIEIKMKENASIKASKYFKALLDMYNQLV